DIAMAQVRGQKSPERLRHFRNDETFPPETDSGLGVPDLMGERTLSVARSVPANLGAADDDSNPGAGFMEKRCRFEGRLSGANQCHVAAGISRQILDLGAMATQWLGQARQLIRDYAERHVPPSQNHASCVTRRRSSKIQQETRAGALQSCDSCLEGFTDRSFPKPFRIAQEVLQAK